MTDEVADQAPAQSVMDRLTAKFGGDQPVESTDSPQTEAELAEVEYEGAKYQVPAKIKDALLRQEDYTRKTQDLASLRKETEHARELAIQRQLDASFGESVAQETDQLKMIDAYLSQVSQKVDWANMTTDQIVRQKIEIDTLKEQRANLKAAIDGKRNEFNTGVKAKFDELRGKSRELASKSITGFNEETEKAVRAFAQTEGLSEAEVDNVLLDPRSFKLLWKAMQFDKVQAGATKATETATKAARVLKPGGAGERMPQEVRDKLEFGKAMKSAKTSAEKARVIEDRFAGLFERRGHTQ
jgi:hypothetical protein